MVRPSSALRVVVSLLLVTLFGCSPVGRPSMQGGARFGSGASAATTWTSDGAAADAPIASPFSEGTLYVAKEGGKATFPLVRTDVDLRVEGQIVSTAVRQRFENPYEARIEATYVFPLPNHAAVDAMEMHIGRRVVRADVRPRAEARAVYEAAAAQGQHAALLEQERPNIFTFSVANIDPGQAIEVELHYFEVARYDHGTYEVAFPMVVGPRYIPDSVADAERITTSYVPPGTRSGHTVGVSVHLDAGLPIEALDAPAHEVDVARRSPAAADVTLKNADEIPDRDFVLRWKVAAKTLETAVFASRESERGDGYVALMLEPRHEPPAEEIAPRELLFLLDTSGSMQGAPLETSLAAVRRALGSLHPSDTFQIIDFADTASSFAAEPLPNTPENVAHAQRYLDALAASGGTNQLAGIHAALTAPGDDTRLRYVMFMTDGYIGNESDVIELVRREVGRARIYGFGVGSSVNRYLLDEVSYVGRGAAEYLRPHEDARAMVERFYRRIGQPYLTDVTIDWGDLAVSDQVPARPRDVSTFEPLVVFGRYGSAGEGTVTVRGRLAGRPYEQKVHVALPETRKDGAAIGRVWARERIAALTREEAASGSREQQIVAIALEHHLVTQYTSLVAVDESDGPDPHATRPVRVEQPAEAPEGVNLATAGGRVATGTTTPSPPPPPAVNAPSGGAVASAAPQPTQAMVTLDESKEEAEVQQPASNGVAPQEPSPVRRSGGCAGCVVGPSPAERAVAPLLLLLVLSIATRRISRAARGSR